MARVLVDALCRIGVPATRTSPDARAPGRDVFDCFAGPAPDEICVGGRKLAGSAQRRIDGALLQHGSIRLRPDPASAVQGTGLAGAGATSLEEIGQGAISESALRSALQESFEDLLGRPLRPGALSPAERALALGRGCRPR